MALPSCGVRLQGARRCEINLRLHICTQQLLQVLSKRAANEIIPLIIYVTGMHTGAGAGISHAAAGVARERRGAETGGPAD